MTSSLGSVPPPPLPPPPLHLNTLPSNVPLLPSQQLVTPALPTYTLAMNQPPPPAISMYNNNNTPTGLLYGEEISTIFVVGFPDDMQEREFQNMFIFSPGFEAATLKVPTKDGEEETTTLAVNGHNKKQIIGFAKFRSRQEALDAKETISGRKVDAEKGSILKAEMAKKNLHTKRGLSSNEPFHPDPPPCYPPEDLVKPNHNSVYEAFHSVPASDPTLISDIYSDLFISRNTARSTKNHRLSGLFTRRFSSFDPDPEEEPSDTVLSPSSSTSITQALQYQHYHHSQKHSIDIEEDLGFTGLTINTNHPIMTTSTTSTPTSPGLLSPTYRSFATTLSTNPADQNPPCNTLYVGNLPPNTDEDELRQMFTRCLGYKRLSFRHKPNGPMCFVEFDDVYCATLALQDLYGNPLSNSVKGGIRLSFSKNPLGVRAGCNAPGLFHPVAYYRDHLAFDPPYS